MRKLKFNRVGIAGAGAMGSGIAQVIATAGAHVFLYDISNASLDKAEKSIAQSLEILLGKNKITEAEKKAIQGRITTGTSLDGFIDCNLIVEAALEEMKVKQDLFRSLEERVSPGCVLASNTSSISIASLSNGLTNPERMIGIHFFNPAVLMPLVEIIPSVLTRNGLAEEVFAEVKAWGKSPVIAKDTPGFIVNRVARPYYGESIRIYEEGIAGFYTIDHAMKTMGGFKMGPFELMDFIGNDVNYKVTESVWTQFFFEPRYKPSLTQKRYFEAGLYGRKSGRGYYNYQNPEPAAPDANPELLGKIFDRVITLLIHEAADTLFWGIAGKEDIDTAMMRGVNYPKGLLKWGDEIGWNVISHRMQGLYERYGEDRYRLSPLVFEMAEQNKTFY